MKTISRIILLVTLSAIAQLSLADAPLKSKLDLDMDQAKVVYDIRKHYRSEIRSVRQQLNKESRKLRRARKDNDSAQVAQLEVTVQLLADDMGALILRQDNEIRDTLNDNQLQKFDNYVAARNAMAGSSRDARVLQNQ